MTIDYDSMTLAEAYEAWEAVRQTKCPAPKCGARPGGACWIEVPKWSGDSIHAARFRAAGYDRKALTAVREKFGRLENEKRQAEYRRHQAEARAAEASVAEGEGEHAGEQEPG
jgi:hypothetical protein